nr:MAG TPA: hypothetical protein [Caudoviricetes sp.]
MQEPQTEEKLCIGGRTSTVDCQRVAMLNSQNRHLGI